MRHRSYPKYCGINAEAISRGKEANHDLGELQNPPQSIEMADMKSSSEKVPGKSEEQVE